MGNSSGWNRPSANQPTVKKGGGKPNLGKGILAGLVCVVIALGVMYFMRDVEKPVAKKAEKKPAKVEEVKPVAQKAVKAETPKDETPADKTSATNAPLGKQKVGEVRNGYVLLPDGTLHRRIGIKKPPEGPEPDRSDWSQVFDSKTDNQIAALLTLEPGEIIIGGIDGGKSFVRAFKESLKIPIITKADDSEDVKNLKKAVKDARQELCDAMRRGEDISQIIKDAYEQSARLARYKSELEAQVKGLVKEGDYTDEEVDTLVEGANKMLADKGIGPMRINSVSRLRVQLLKKKEQRERSLQNEQENNQGGEQ